MTIFVDEQENQLVHILYDFSMFLDLTKQLKFEKQTIRTYNIYLQNHRILIRKLLDFFDANNINKKDVHAHEFFNSSVPFKKYNVNKQKELKRYISKHAAHITKNPEKFKVDEDQYKEAIYYIVTNIRIFMENLDKNLKSKHEILLNDPIVRNYRINIRNDLILLYTRGLVDEEVIDYNK